MEISCNTYYVKQQSVLAKCVGFLSMIVLAHGPHGREVVFCDEAGFDMTRKSHSTVLVTLFCSVSPHVDLYARRLTEQ